MTGLHEQTKQKATDAGKRDAKNGLPLDSKARDGSMWDVYYKKGYKYGA